MLPVDCRLPGPAESCGSVSRELTCLHLGDIDIQKLLHIWEDAAFDQEKVHDLTSLQSWKEMLSPTTYSSEQTDGQASFQKYRDCLLQILETIIKNGDELKTSSEQAAPLDPKTEGMHMCPKQTNAQERLQQKLLKKKLERDKEKQEQELQAARQKLSILQIKGLFQGISRFSIIANQIVDTYNIATSVQERKLALACYNIVLGESLCAAVLDPKCDVFAFEEMSKKRAEHYLSRRYWDMYAKSQKWLLSINGLLASEWLSLESKGIGKKILSTEGFVSDSDNCPWDLPSSSVFYDAELMPGGKNKATFLFHLKHKSPELSDFDVLNSIVLDEGHQNLQHTILLEKVEMLKDRVFPAFAYALGAQGFVFPIQRRKSVDISLPPGYGLFLSRIWSSHVPLWGGFPRREGAPCPVREMPFHPLIPEPFSQAVYIKEGSTIFDGILQHILHARLERSLAKLSAFMPFLSQRRKEVSDFEALIKDSLEALRVVLEESEILSAAGYMHSIDADKREEVKGSCEEALSKSELSEKLTKLYSTYAKILIPSPGKQKDDTKQKEGWEHIWSIRKVVQYSVQEEGAASLAVRQIHGETQKLLIAHNCSTEFLLFIMSVSDYMDEIDRELSSSDNGMQSFDCYVPDSVMGEKIFKVMQDFKQFLDGRDLSGQQYDTLRVVESWLNISIVVKAGILTDLEGQGSADEGAPSGADCAADMTYWSQVSADESAPSGAASAADMTYYSKGSVDKKKSTPPTSGHSRPSREPTSPDRMSDQRMRSFLEFCYDGRDRRLPEEKEILNHKAVRDLYQLDSGPGSHVKAVGEGHVSMPRRVGDSPIKKKIYIKQLIKWLCRQIEIFAEIERAKRMARKAPAH